jgi:hypothetical protein
MLNLTGEKVKKCKHKKYNPIIFMIMSIIFKKYWLVKNFSIISTVINQRKILRFFITLADFFQKYFILALFSTFSNF